MRLQVRVSPGAARERVLGWRGEALKVAVQAPPERGKANKAVVSLLAEVLGLPEASIRVVSGETSRDKVLELPLERAGLEARLGRTGR